MCYIFWSKDVKPNKQPGYKLIRRQQIYIKDVQASIKEFVQQKEEQGGDLGSRVEEEEGELDKEIKQIGRIQ